MKLWTWQWYLKLPVFDRVMVFGPLLGAGGGAIGGFVAAGHPLTPRPARSWAVGLFARF